MAEQSNTPQLRFQGYTDAWGQERLGDIAQITMGQSPDGATYTDNPKDHILVQGNADMKDHRVCPRVWTTQVTKTAEPGDIILSVRAPVGEVGKTDYDVVLGRGVSGIRGNDFIYHSLIRMNEIGYWSSLSTGSTFDSINSNDISNAVIAVPSQSEQEKIGCFLTRIDDLLSLHQRKLDKLQAIKKSLLQKMFPAEGEDRPQIRFAGYTDAWGQERLGNVCSFDKGQGYSKENLVDDGQPIILYGRMYVQYESVIHDVDTFVPKGSQGVFSKGNEVIIPASGETAEDISRASFVDKSGVLLGGDLNILTPDGGIDPAFLAMEISSGKVKRDLSSKAQGKTIVHIHKDDIASLEAGFPSLDEQRKISSVFLGIDSLLSLHQRKLEKLQQIKKALLQKMFC